MFGMSNNQAERWKGRKIYDGSWGKFERDSSTRPSTDMEDLAERRRCSRAVNQAASVMDVDALPCLLCAERAPQIKLATVMDVNKSAEL